MEWRVNTHSICTVMATLVEDRRNRAEIRGDVLYSASQLYFIAGGKCRQHLVSKQGQGPANQRTKPTPNPRTPAAA